MLTLRHLVAFILLAATAGAVHAGLREGALIGTASVRRKAQLLARRPDLRVVDFRGNVDSRLRKLEAGEADAILLALAGLQRLGIEPAGMVILARDEMLPAVGQGAIGVECRADDGAAVGLLAAIDHLESHACVRAERALLAALDGSCHTPIAGLADDRVYLWHGSVDDVVATTVVDALQAYYATLVTPASIERVELEGAAHTFPVEDASLPPCDVTAEPFVGRCGYAGARRMFEHLYGPAPDGPLAAPHQFPVADCVAAWLL